MMAAMVQPGRAVLIAGAAFALCSSVACDRGEALAWLGWRTIHEIPVETALGWLEDERAVLLQPRVPGQRFTRLAETELLGPEEPLPDALVARAWAGAWLLVVAPRQDEALRLAARLARAGLPRVGVVRGEADALAELRMASRAPATAQPRQGSGHRSD